MKVNILLNASENRCLNELLWFDELHYATHPQITNHKRNFIDKEEEL